MQDRCTYVLSVPLSVVVSLPSQYMMASIEQLRSLRDQDLSDSLRTSRDILREQDATVYATRDILPAVTVCEYSGRISGRGKGNPYAEHVGPRKFIDGSRCLVRWVTFNSCETANCIFIQSNLRVFLVTTSAITAGQKLSLHQTRKISLTNNEQVSGYCRNLYH